MRKITIANENLRDATVGFERKTEKNIRNLGPYKSQRFIKQTVNTQESFLLKKYGNDKIKLANAIIESNPEIDFENAGRKVESLHKVFLTQDAVPAYSARLEESICGVDGKEIERRAKKEFHATVNDVSFPIKWTGLLIPQKEAARKYVFSRIYQLHHVNGLTFDFLFDMARKLGDSESIMYIAGGESGTEPIVLQDGGKPYRGFLYGWTEKKSYVLLLLLSELELKEITEAEVSV